MTKPKKSANPKPQSKPASRVTGDMRNFLALLVILLAVGAVFFDLLSASAVSPDDRSYMVIGKAWAHRYEKLIPIIEEDIREAKHLLDIVTEQGIIRPEGTAGFYQPLVTTSLMADALMVDDPNASGYYFHRTNLAFHLLNVALVFLILRRWSASPFWPSVLTLLFALHPIQVETVAAISQRMTLMATTFAFLSMLGYFRYVRTDHSRWMVLTMIWFAAILLTRPLFLALPAVFLILDAWPFERRGWRPLLEKAPLLGLVVVGTYIAQFIRDRAEPVDSGEIDGIALLAHNATALIARVFWPFDLLPHHPLSTSVGTLALGRWFDIMVLLVVFVTLVWAFRRARPLFVALGGFLLMVIPALMQAPYSRYLLSDQYLYAALIVPLICIAAAMRPGTFDFSKRTRQWSAIVAGCLAFSFAVGSYAQSTHWITELHLAQHTRDLYPDKAIGYIKLVEAYIHENEYDAALRFAEQAANREPDDPTTQFYLGTLILQTPSGRSGDAIAPLTRALESDSDWIECLQNLGVAYARSGEPEKAIQYFEKARDMNPGSADIRVGLGNAYLSVARYSSARGEFAEALKFSNDPKAHLGLAIAWAGNEAPDMALRHLSAALAKDPKYSEQAGRSPVIRRYADRPEFKALIDMSQTISNQSTPVTESPTSFGS